MEQQVIEAIATEERPGRNGGTLSSWKPGVSGNPEGMQKGTLHFSTIMNMLLTQQINITIDNLPFKVTRAQALMLEKLRLATSAKDESVRLRAIMDIEDRVDGRPVPTAPAPLDGDDDGAIFYFPNQNSRIKKRT